VIESENRKNEFLRGKKSSHSKELPLASAAFVGVSYLCGALVPIVPVFFGAHTIFLPLLADSLLLLAVSFIVAFLSGMEVKWRIMLNIGIMAFAVIVTYALGIIAKNIFGITV